MGNMMQRLLIILFFWMALLGAMTICQSQGLKGTGLPIGKIGLSKASGNINDVGLDNPPGGSSYQTRAIKYLWLYTDLTDGAVSSWTDEISAYSIGQTVTASKPTKGSTGITFDGGDWLTAANPTTSDTAMTITIILKIVDTIATQQTLIFGSSISSISLMNAGTGYSTFKKLQIGYSSNGLDRVQPCYLTNSQNCYQRICMFTMAYKSLTTNSFYINDTLQSALPPYNYWCLHYYEATLGTYCNGHGAFNVVNGTMILALKVNFAYLTQAEILVDYNYFKGLGYIQ